jgi:anthranilate phosphoribosyltransferase
MSIIKQRGGGILSMKEIIAKIGKGPKTSKDLTWDEAKQAVKFLIEGQASAAQIGAFVVAMRLKVESVAELAAFTAAARQYVSALTIPRGLTVVDLPTYAGKRETFHASIASAIIAAAAGVAVLMHGFDDVPERLGTAAVLNRLGIPVDLEPARVCNELAAKGFAYLDLALYHPPMARFLELRNELGLRNLFHPVAKMLNPARAEAQVIGVSHPAYFEKTAEALAMLRSRRALVVRGVEGEPELSCSSVTKVLELKDDRISSRTLSPREVGFTMGRPPDMTGFPAERGHAEVSLLRKVLSNEVRGGPRDWVVFNAAMLLYVSGKTPSISAAIAPAQHTIDSGAAAQKLTELVRSPRPISA